MVREKEGAFDHQSLKNQGRKSHGNLTCPLAMNLV